MLQGGGGAFCNTFDLSKLLFVIKIFAFGFLEWPFYTSFTVLYSEIAERSYVQSTKC